MLCPHQHLVCTLNHHPETGSTSGKREFKWQIMFHP